MTAARNSTREHAEVWAAIPWCVAGSASEAEAARVREHLNGCADCRSEWAFQERLREGFRDDDGDEAGHTDDADASLARLWPRLDAAVPEPVAAWAIPAAATPPRWWRVLAVASVVQAMALVALAALWWLRSDDAAFGTLSTPPPAAAAHSAELLLVLAPATSIGELQSLLDAERLRVTGLDPSTGAFRLAAADPQQLPAAVTRLRADRRVLFVEPTAGR